MSFRFNWGRLDETAAEAIRLLINKKLKQMLDEKMNDTSGGGGVGVAGTTTGLAAASHHNLGVAPNAAAAAGGGSGLGDVSESTSTLGNAGTAHGASAPGSCLGGTGNGVTFPAAAPAPSPMGAAGLSTAPSTGAAVTAAAAGGSAAGPVMKSTLLPGTAATGGGVSSGAVPLPGTLGNPSTGGGGNGGVGGGGGGGLSSVHGLSVTPSTTATSATTPAGSPAGIVSAAAGAVGGGGASGAAATAGGAGGGAGPVLGGTAAATTAKKKPLLEHLTVTSLDWGTAPPFVELVNLSDALTFLEPDSPCAGTSQLASTSYQSGGGPASAHYGHPHTHPSASGGGGGGAGVSSVAGSGHGQHGRQSPHLFTPPVPLAAAATSGSSGVGGTGASGIVGGLEAVADTSLTGMHASAYNSGSSLGNVHSPAAVGPGPGGHGAPGSATVLPSSPSRAPGYSQGTPHGQQHLKPTPRREASESSNMAHLAGPRGVYGGSSMEAADEVDTLAPYLGPGGLFVRLHVTYGGSLRFSLASAVQYDLNLLGPSVTLPLRMPLALFMSEMDLDCYVCCNLHKNRCRIWLEPGKLSASPINRLSAMAVFGEKHSSSPYCGGGLGDGEDVAGGGSGNGYAGNGVSSSSVPINPSGSGLGTTATGAEGTDYECDSSADYFSRYESSYSEDGVDDAVFVDERQVEQFLVRELKALLKNSLVAPHYITVPVVLGS